MIRQSFPVALVLALTLPASAADKPVVIPEGQTIAGRVVGVHDGDTITALADGNRQVKVRLMGIDAPELGQPFGQAAKRALSGMVFGKTVEIEAGKKDRWGRTLGAVNVAGKPVAEAMVAEGLAWHYTRYSDDEHLADAERAARAARRGLWADGKAVPPWEWRASEKSARKSRTRLISPAGRIREW